jgi:DNA invertase Pin-like site-specific DNA recombinase
MQYEGWIALDERFDDHGVSGGNLERPALRRLLSRCVQGRVDVVAVTSLDRLARKTSDGVRLNDWLKQPGVEPGDRIAAVNRLRQAWERRTIALM